MSRNVCKNYQYSLRNNPEERRSRTLSVFDWLSDWLINIWVRDLTAPMHLGFDLTGLLCPISNQGSPVTLLKFQMDPKPKLLTSSGSKENEPRYACLREVKASHSQRMWAEVSSITLHPLHNGLSSSPSRWKCLHWVLCPLRRPVTTLACSACLRVRKMITDNLMFIVPCVILIVE